MSAPPVSRARGRGRGGLGKYLRARGHRGPGRAAEFTPRLRPEEEEELDEEEDQRKYAKREIGTNTYRYEEPEADENVEQEESEPDVDLSAFIAKQRLSEINDRNLFHDSADNEVEVDRSLSQITHRSSQMKPSKNKVQTIEWDQALNELKLEKESADAVRDLKSRFRQNQQKFVLPSNSKEPQPSTKTEDVRHVPRSLDAVVDDKFSGPEKAEMEEFLDELLT